MANNYYNEVALVLSASECGLGVIRSLGEDPRIKIICLAKKSQAGTVSKYLSKCYYFNNYDRNEIIEIFKKIDNEYSNIIPIPAGNDFWVNILVDARNELRNFVIEYDKQTLELMRKDVQAKICTDNNIPYPASVTISKHDDLNKAKVLKFPLIVKPVRRSAEDDIFRNKIFHDYEEFNEEMVREIGRFRFIVSEYITGPDSELYTYGSYSYNGLVMTEFSGRKLTQKPMGTGTAGIAETVRGSFPFQSDSRKFLETCRFSGISQIEFKRSARDGLYYFMEFNPRSWLWIYLATVKGENLPLAQYYTLTGREDRVKPLQNNNDERFLYISGRSIMYNTFKEFNFLWLKHIVKRIFSHKIVYAVKNKFDSAPYKKASKKMFLRGNRKL